MASETIEVAALGRPLFPGTLYDCRKDTFIPAVTLWDKKSLTEDLDTRPQPRTNVKFCSSDSLSSKSSLLDVSASLKASFLGGLVEVEGSAKFLRDTKSSNQQSRVTMYYSETRRFEQLTMTQLGEITYPQVFDQKTATHVVTAVLYGAQAIMVFDRTISEEEEKQKIEGELNVMVKKIPKFSIEGQGAVNMTDAQMKVAEKTTCTFYGDVHLDQNPTTYTEALEVYRKLPTILNEKPQNAVPIKVWLHPLSQLDTKAAQLEREISTSLVFKTEDIIEGLGEVERTCKDLSRKTLVNVFNDIKERLQLFQGSLNIYKTVLLKAVAKVLPAIRGGEMEKNSLENILKIHYSSPFKADMLNQWLDHAKAELNLLSSHTKILKGIKTEDSNHLKTILFDPNIDVVVCLTFTSLKYEDPDLSTLKKFLESEEFKELDVVKLQSSTVASVRKWFNDPNVTSKMRENLSLFRSFSKANKDEERYRFIISAISDPSSPGSSIYLYKKGKLTDTQFQPVSKPPPPEVKEILEDSVSLKLQKSPTGESVQFRVEYQQVKAYSGAEEQWMIINTADEDFTLTGLKSGNQYLIRYRIVGKVGVSEASDTIGPTQSSAVSRGSARRRRRSKEEEPPNMSYLRIVLLGKSVSENSRVGNFILGHSAFDSEAPPDVVERVGGRLKDRRVMVINSSQLLNTHFSDHQITQTVRECVSLSDPGPHAFILVLQNKDFTEEDMRRVKQVLEKFSEEAIKRTIVITTDKESHMSLSYFLKDKSINQLIKECGRRHLQIDEKKPEWQSEIFKSVDKILEENQRDYLTCDIFHDVKESSVDEEKSRSEEENKEHYQENDGKPKEVSENISGKQKLNLVLCGSDGSLTVSVSKLLQGKTFNPSDQKANSKECVKKEERIHGRVISLVELPAVNHLSEEEVMHQTLRCVSLCDPGVHVFLLTVPDAPLTDKDKAEIEKIQKIFDSREHFMVLFTSYSTKEPADNFIKHSPDSQSLIRLCGDQYRVMGLKEPENSRQIPKLLDYIEDMKTEPYSLQMYVKAQENRVRHEAEEKYKEELKRLEDENKELQARIQSDGAEKEADDQKSLRIVLIGRTGSGKSATGNTILGRKEFHSQSNTDSVTTDCEKRVGEVDGRSVAVVDTPGLFDTTLTNDQVVEEIVKCVSMSSPGPHVFIIVLSVGRFTKEETDTVDLIKKIFGHKSAQFSIVLFTRGDDLEGESIEDYVKRSKSGELQKLIRDCGNRFLAFNNREKQDKTQVTRLLNMIEEVRNANEGRYFTNSMFEEAEMSIKKRMEEIIKEREREMQNQREELQAKYEMDMKIMTKRLEEEKQRADEERKKMENQIREKEEKLRREFEEKEKTEQKKREIEDQKRSEEEKQRRAEYHQRIEEMKREIENQRLQHEKQQREREEEDRKREEKYRQDQEKMKNEQEHIIAEFQRKQKEEIKKRELEEIRRKKEEEEERKRWERKIKEAENDRKETQEEIKRQQREWEDEKKRQMREREEEERKKKEKHEEQLREKLEEQEKMRKRFEREREEERKKIEEERQKQRREREEKEREYEENKTEMKRHYERLERERKEEGERRRREDDERREEERKRWKKHIEDLKQEQEEEIKRRETERKEKEEKMRHEMKKNHEEEIQAMKKKHEDEARKQAEETNDLKGIKEELQHKLEEHQKQYEILEKLFQLTRLQKGVWLIYEFFKYGTKVEDLHRRLQDMKGDELKKLQEEVEELWKESNKSEESNKSNCVIL